MLGIPTTRRGRSSRRRSSRAVSGPPSSTSNKHGISALLLLCAVRYSRASLRHACLGSFVLMLNKNDTPQLPLLLLKALWPRKRPRGADQGIPSECLYYSLILELEICISPSRSVKVDKSPSASIWLIKGWIFCTAGWAPTLPAGLCLDGEGFRLVLLQASHESVTSSPNSLKTVTPND